MLFNGRFVLSGRFSSSLGAFNLSLNDMGIGGYLLYTCLQLGVKLPTAVETPARVRERGGRVRKGKSRTLAASAPSLLSQSNFLHNYQRVEAQWPLWVGSRAGIIPVSCHSQSFKYQAGLLRGILNADMNAVEAWGQEEGLENQNAGPVAWEHSQTAEIQSDSVQNLDSLWEREFLSSSFLFLSHYFSWSLFFFLSFYLPQTFHSIVIFIVISIVKSCLSIPLSV